MRQKILDHVRSTLIKSGFYVSDPHQLSRISFDIVARRDKSLLFIKVLANVDSFSSGNAEELIVLSSSLKGAPLVIGSHSGAGKLEAGVVYSRFDIPIISIDTFDDFLLDGVPPFIFAAPGGFYVQIDRDVLRRARERGITLGQLAEATGVSRRTIQMYEDGMGTIVDVALRLEDFLKEPVVLPLDPFGCKERVDESQTTLDQFHGPGKKVFERLGDLGYLVQPTARCPFDALASDRKAVILTGVGSNEKAVVKRARVVTNLSRIVEEDAVIFIERKGRHTELEGTAVISRQELDRIRDPVMVKELIMERRKRD